MPTLCEDIKNNIVYGVECDKCGHKHDFFEITGAWQIQQEAVKLGWTVYYPTNEIRRYSNEEVVLCPVCSGKINPDAMAYDLLDYDIEQLQELLANQMFSDFEDIRGSIRRTIVRLMEVSKFAQ